MTIWKYPLELTDEQQFRMPVGAKPLSVATQNGQLCLWALVDPSPYAPKETRRFYLRGTGHPMDDAVDAAFIGTVMMHGGTLVFHVFDGGRA